MTAAPTDKPVPPDPLAFLPRQDRHKPKCGPVRPSKMSRRRMWVLVAVHVLIGLHIVHWLWTGSSLSPVEPSEAMQTVEMGRINAGFLLFVGLIACTLVFGRFFCGWACHVVALQDLCAWLLGRVGLRPRPLRSRLLVFAPWVVGGYMFVWPVVHAWLGTAFDATWRELGWTWLMRPPLPAPADWEWHLETSSLMQTFPGPLMAVGTIVVVGFLIVYWLGAKGFCTHGCPYGAFFATADRLAPVRIKVTDACDACGHCTNVCTSNVRVHEEVAKHGKIVDPGCMKCLDCVSVCPKDALYVGLAWPKPFAVSQQRIGARADFTWAEEVLLAVVAVFSTQWVWRSAWFGEGIPFLMAVGLGVLTAVFALLFVRLLLRPDVVFQHTEIKRSGKWTGPGRLTLVGLIVGLLFTVHTGIAQWRFESAFEQAREPVHRAFFDPRLVDPAALQGAIDGFDHYTSWALVDDPRVVELRALALRGLGRHVEAEKALLDAIGDREALLFDEASLALAQYCMDPARRRFDDAERLVAHVMKHQPGHPVGRILQQQLAQRPK